MIDIQKIRMLLASGAEVWPRETIEAICKEVESTRAELAHDKAHFAEVWRAEHEARKKAEVELAAAKEMLRKYGRHTESCGIESWINGQDLYHCSCGYDAALAGTGEA